MKLSLITTSVFLAGLAYSEPASAQNQCFRLIGGPSHSDSVRGESSFDFTIENRCEVCVKFWLEPRKNGQSVQAKVSIGNAVFQNPLQLEGGDRHPYRMTVQTMNGTYGPAASRTEYCE